MRLWVSLLLYRYHWWGVCGLCKRLGWLLSAGFVHIIIIMDWTWCKECFIWFPKFRVDWILQMINIMQFIEMCYNIWNNVEKVMTKKKTRLKRDKVKQTSQSFFLFVFFIFICYSLFVGGHYGFYWLFWFSFSEKIINISKGWKKLYSFRAHKWLLREMECGAFHCTNWMTLFSIENILRI